MSKILIVAEHDGAKLNASTLKCVTCAGKIAGAAIDIVVLAADGDESARANLARSAALLSAAMAAEGLRRAQEWRNTRIP